MDAAGQGRIFLLLKLFFSPVGRIRPGLYWMGLAALSLAGLAVTAAFGMFTGPPYTAAIAAWSTVVLHTPGPGFVVSLTTAGPQTSGTAFSGVIVAAFCVMAFCVQAKRLHDAGQSAWWIVAFAVFQMVSPLGLGLLTRALYRPDDLRGFLFAVGSNLFVGLFLPLVVKLVIGFLPSRPEPNAHGPRPGPREIGLPEGRPRLSFFGKRKA